MCPRKDSGSLVLPKLYFRTACGGFLFHGKLYFFLSVEEVPAQIHVHYDVTLKLSYPQLNLSTVWYLLDNYIFWKYAQYCRNKS
jgi:hypothetical protein